MSESISLVFIFLKKLTNSCTVITPVSAEISAETIRLKIVLERYGVIVTQLEHTDTDD